MPEKSHGDHRTDTAADGGKGKERQLRYSPPMFLGTQLVPAIDGKSSQINDGTVDVNYIAGFQAYPSKIRFTISIPSALANVP